MDIKNRKLKTITIDGRELQYERCVTVSDWCDYVSCHFYEGTTTKTYKKFKFFGEKITVTEPKHIFTIHRDIESKHLTKKDVRIMIKRELELLNREEEIKKGDLI